MSQKKNRISKIFIIIILLLTSALSQATISLNDETDTNTTLFTEKISISKPNISLNESEKTQISLNNSKSFLMEPGKPRIPTIKKTYTFPKETKIQQINCYPTATNKYELSHPIQKNPLNNHILKNNIDIHTKKTNETPLKTYPEKWYTTQTGAGITSSGEHVIYVTITLYPYKYHSENNTITAASNFNITITQTKNQATFNNKSFENTHELIIITPDHYVSTLNPFINHKQNHGLHPLVKTTTEIYNQFQGRDKQEQIKYFIKHAIETFGAQYVLLIGDITQIPIRNTDAYPWGSYHGSGILTDLYYADVYDSSYAFSSWDTNNNDIFGEVVYKERDYPYNPLEFIDEVDLYPDVHIGRIPCTNNNELSTVLSNIITYETITAYQNWFQKIILAGGDTFPLTKSLNFNVFEGEITNVKVGQQLSEFKQIRLWSSERTLNARTFNQAISEGAGFLSYAGHGFEHGWGTYRPNAIIDGNLISYFTPFLKLLRNEHRRPVVFFDACLTAKLDFNISDLTAYYGLKGHIIRILLGFDNNEKYYPSFAWSFIKQERGGGIAAIGATRPAYTLVDKEGVYAGAGFLDVRFFNAYEEGITVGEMLSKAQTDYQNYVGKDTFTIEEYLLLGDPSLRVGGYL